LPALHQVVLDLCDQADEDEEYEKKETLGDYDKTERFLAEEFPGIKNIEDRIHDPAQYADGQGKDYALRIIIGPENPVVVVAIIPDQDEKYAQQRPDQDEKPRLLDIIY
jgi:hypothetical protein